MNPGAGSRLADAAGLVQLSARTLAGRWWWASALLPWVWLGFLYFRLAVGWRVEAYRPEEAQVTLLSMPLVVLAILLGVRVIAGEIDRGTLEIAYTVPGGAHRVWLSKVAAAAALVVATEVLAVPVVYVFFTDFPPGALYGAFQAAVFYLALSVWLSALFKSEYTGALLAVAAVTLNGLLTAFGGNPSRLSPFWNPSARALRSYAESDVLAWTVQNRVGFVLVVAALLAMSVARAERREKMLGA